MIQEERTPERGPGRPEMSPCCAYLLQRIESLEAELQQKGFRRQEFSDTLSGLVPAFGTAAATDVLKPGGWATPLGGGGNEILTFIAASPSSQYTNQPAAVRFWLGDAANATVCDLSSVTSVRLSANVVRPGHTGAKVFVRYRSAGFSSTAGDYSVLGDSSTEVQVEIDTAGVFDSGVIALDASAGASGVGLALLCDGGNGATSPDLAMVRLELIA